MPKISIIIPVYNVEKYLAECVDSVLAQTFTDFECILIDDGSLDRSPSICDEYAEKDCRIKVIHKKNGGVSSARNAGLDIAQGEWIVFIDSDDWVDERYLECLYGNAVKNDADVSICGVNFFKDGFIWRLNNDIYDVMLASEDAILRIFSDKSTFRHIPCKLFKKLFLEKDGLRFDEAVQQSEDMLFYYNLFKATNKIYYCPQPHYFYRQVETSVVHQPGFTPMRNTAISALDVLYQNESNQKIKQKILSCNMYIICRACINCILRNKKDETFLSNINVLKERLLSPSLPLPLRCYMFLTAYLPLLIPIAVYLKRIMRQMTEIRVLKTNQREQVD
jgi:glycosyltransferase involved in cell wall biosynthesis